MAGNDWNHLGKDVKDIVQHALDTGDFGALNRDLGVTLENALGNVAQSVKNAGNTIQGNQRRRSEGDPFFLQSQNYEEPKPYGPGNGYSKYHYQPLRHNGSMSPKKMKKARQELALFVNTGGARALGILLTTLGTALALMFGITAGSLGIAAMFTASLANVIGRVMLLLVPATLLSIGVGVWGSRLRKRIKRFRTYVKTLNGRPYGSIKDLAKSVRKSERFVVKDLKKMIHKRMFLEGHLDKAGTCLIASDDAYEQYMDMVKNAEEQKKVEAQRAQQKEESKGRLSEEVRAVIDEGDRYIEEIRRSNDAIQGVEISNKIYHLENVILRIFQRVEQHPELLDDLHKFMDYYLPTTVKLLNAYEELDRQDLGGQNVKAAKQEIENTLDTINIAFENLLDSFYQDTAWDLSADISVLKTMLAQEGLTGNKDFQRKDKRKS